MSSSSSPASVPRKLGVSDFHFGSLLGEGAYARVLHARCVPTGVEYAVKVLDKRFMVKQGKTSFVMMERSVMTRAAHAHIVGLKYSFQDADSLYFVMDLCRGGDLNSVLTQFKSGLPLTLTRFYAAQVVLALEYLHCTLQVVHRDLKPDNILLTSTGHVKLADFGTARDETVADSSTSTVSFVGTAEYVPPELLRDEVVTAACDLWALGVTLYAAATGGGTPFKSGSEYLTFQVILGYDDAATRTAWGVDLNAPPGDAVQVDDTCAGVGVDETGRLRFPSGCTPTLVDLILRLLVQAPQQRLGVSTSTDASARPCGALYLNYDALKRHPFLAVVDFNSVSHAAAPYVPPFKSLPEPEPAGKGGLLADADMAELGLSRPSTSTAAPAATASVEVGRPSSGTSVGVAASGAMLSALWSSITGGSGSLEGAAATGSSWRPASTPAPSTSTAARPVDATVTPLTLPRSPPSSPLPETRMSDSASLDSLVIEQYLPAAAATTTTALPSSSLHVHRPVPTSTAAVAVEAPPPFWQSHLDARERVTLHAKLRKRRAVTSAPSRGMLLAMPIIHFTPPERELVLTAGHPAGPRLLYINPAGASRSVRSHVLREEEVRVTLVDAPHEAADACDFDLLCGGVTHALCDAQGAARWVAAITDAKTAAATAAAAALGAVPSATPLVSSA